MILPIEQYPPAAARHRSAIQGIFVNGCVDRGDGSRFRAKAHAHTTGRNKGWICVLTSRRLACNSLILHEVAHIMTGAGHCDKWRAQLLLIGGTLDAVPGIMKDYHKVSRRGSTL